MSSDESKFFFSFVRPDNYDQSLDHRFKDETICSVMGVERFIKRAQ